MFSSLFSLLSTSNESLDIKSPDTTTQNGDPAYSTTNLKCLDFFSNVCRDGNKLSSYMESQIVKLLPQCWNESPLDTLKLIFNKRDCRGGAGEKKIFEVSYKWLITNHFDTALKNLEFIPEFGYYKDLLNFLDTPMDKEVYKLFSNNLKKDLSALKEYNNTRGVATVMENKNGESSTTLELGVIEMDDNISETEGSTEETKEDLVGRVINLPSISLAAKWAPSIGCHHDKKYGACKHLSYFLGFNDKYEARYRKDILNPLRQYLKTVERLMSSKKWNEIDFSKVPSVAMRKLKGAFKRHDPVRFEKWISEVKSGKSKVNSKQLMPHELVKKIDGVSEIQWKSLVEETKKLGSFNRTLPVCDLSGSMGCGDGIAYWVSIALGLLLSECAQPPFNGLMVTFSANPQFFNIDGGSLKQRVDSILKSPSHGLNTDLVKTFRVILDRCKSGGITTDNMPEKILIISDMQFDQANPGLNVTSYDMIKNMYMESGYKLPSVVFWNVHGDLKIFPVRRNEYNTCTISGFSPSILKTVLSGDIPDPYTIMRRTLDDTRYSCLTV